MPYDYHTTPTRGGSGWQGSVAHSEHQGARTEVEERALKCMRAGVMWHRCGSGNKQG